jgi:hypothetical protein
VQQQQPAWPAYGLLGGRLLIAGAPLPAQTNTTGPFLLTQALFSAGLIGNRERPSLVVNISSVVSGPDHLHHVAATEGQQAHPGPSSQVCVPG